MVTSHGARPAPSAGDEPRPNMAHCAVCGWDIHQISHEQAGVLGMVWIHTALGTVGAPNPPFSKDV